MGMRTPGTPLELERRRRLAVDRLSDGYSADDVAAFLGVAPRTVWRWAAAGPTGLAARSVPGRPPKLTPAQERTALRWLDDRPTGHGFPTDLWTAGRLARLIEDTWGVRFHPDYLGVWLRRRGRTPQRPRRVARERDQAAIDRWVAEDWPRIKKKPGGGGRTCC
jgi:transposase